jgi:3D (Asp-Asp-Asp) domain-containing protein
MASLRVLAVVLALSAGCSRHAPTAPPPTEPAPPDIAAAGVKPATASPTPPGQLRTFEATAYSIEGRTRSGTPTREGVVAADPSVLPLGSRIRVHDAGEYDGEYVVRDTGAAVKGREIDIYLRNDAEAKRFGRRTVKVEVLERGEPRSARD